MLDIAEAPSEVTDCSSLCRRYGVLLAYYLKTQVEVRNALDRARDPTRKRMSLNALRTGTDILGKARLKRLHGVDTEKYLD